MAQDDSPRILTLHRRVGRGLAMHAQGDCSAGYSASTVASAVATESTSRRTTTKIFAGTTEDNHTGIRTAAVDATAVGERVAAAVELTVDAVVELNGVPSTTPPVAAAKGT